MMKKLKPFYLFLIALLLSSCGILTTVEKESSFNSLEDALNVYTSRFNEGNLNFYIPPKSEITSVKIDSVIKQITFETNKNFSFRYLRENDVDFIYSETGKYIKEFLPDYKIVIKSITFPIEELVPNIYRSGKAIDKSRMPPLTVRPKQVVRNINKPFEITSGLNNRNIALWHSHGWYYNHDLDRWLWQRARLFQMVEDLGPMAYTLPYLVPMLENAGANVFLPRERDTQLNEIVIDNDSYSESSITDNYKESGDWQPGQSMGFLYGQPPYEANYNPFYRGSHKISKSKSVADSQVEFTPDIPEDGEYAVYVSYVASSQNVDDAHYTVYHSGGLTEFEVNQTIGGNSWYYLGTFDFKKEDNNNAKVVVDNKSATPDRIVSADVVRFGGGMGVVKRNGSISGKPKYMEGARYYLQYTGMPDTLVYNINNDSTDYVDDYQSRGEWVNYLAGNPVGPNKDRTKGLGIPIDLSLAFHTDAGITNNDTTIGTLSIYSLTDIDSNYVFPDGVSRIVNRDLADVLQTQIVEDLRVKYDPVWNRRQLFDGRYSEASRPNVPSVLLELLSHQNFLDNKFQLDPRYRFDVSRSIYKAFLKFLAYQNNYDYVVQPLPVTHLSVELINKQSVRLSWKPQFDSIEKTAVPTGYVVYTRLNDNGFDNGVYTSEPELKVDGLEAKKIYSFKVTAVNQGGESMPSEIISAGLSEDSSKIALVVNAFDRVCGPATVTTNGFSGFADFIDEGVPDKYDLSYTGSQHDFNPASKWTTDDIPGHGASYADIENKIIAGNSFDFIKIHGKALLENGVSFVSSSDESVEDGLVNINKYNFVDVIFGEEKETQWVKSFTDSLLGTQFKVFSEKIKSAIFDYLDNAGNLFISGSYIGSDLFLGKEKEHPDKNYALTNLKYKLDSDHAVRNGFVHSFNNSFIEKGYKFSFNTSFSDSIYKVEAPDAIGSTKESEPLLRYSENDYTAATGYKDKCGVVAFGFPFETIIGSNDRAKIMKAILEYLQVK